MHFLYVFHGNCRQHHIAKPETGDNTGGNNQQWRDWGSNGHIFTRFIHNLQYIMCFLWTIKSVASWLPWLPRISHPRCHGEACTDDKVTVTITRCIGTKSTPTQLSLLLIPNSYYGWKRVLFAKYTLGMKKHWTHSTDGSNVKAKIITCFAVRIMKRLIKANM